MEASGIGGGRETKQVQDEAAIGPLLGAHSCSSNLHVRIL
jgi:hypothetical protein